MGSVKVQTDIPDTMSANIAKPIIRLIERRIDDRLRVTVRGEEFGEFLIIRLTYRDAVKECSIVRAYPMYSLLDGIVVLPEDLHSAAVARWGRDGMPTANEFPDEPQMAMPHGANIIEGGLQEMSRELGERVFFHDTPMEVNSEMAIHAGADSRAHRAPVDNELGE